MTPLHIRMLVLLCLLIMGATQAGESKKGQIGFNRDIRPILAETCFHCHGPDPGSRKAGLRLDREDGFFGDREGGPTVVKGKPEASPLYKHITSKDPEEIMPPPASHKVLKPEEKELIKKWIAQGAPWEAHWSFIKPEKTALPKVKKKDWIKNPIDNFVAAKLDALKLEPAPEADKYTLARRAALDLTGLPPEQDLLEQFIADKSPDAYERLVDQLIKSPRYGEHRARYWLDAARYADTHGLHFDNYREIWPYRDWVINALNQNMPFDQFTIEQLAGDLLNNPTKEQLIATGFHRCNMTTNEGGTIAEENLANYARDRVETTSWVWLGLTANCAVCHDHKFDPITQKDFYAMSAFFRNTTQGALDGNIPDTAPILVLPKNQQDEIRWGALPQEIAAAQKVVADRLKALRPDFDKWLETAKPEDWKALVEKAGGAPAVHVPLVTAEQPSDQVALTAGGSAVTAKAKAPIAERADDGKFGKAPLLNDKTTIEVGNYGDFDTKEPFSYGCWVKMPKDYKGAAAILSRMDESDAYRGWDLMAQEQEFAMHFIHKWPDDAIKAVTTGRQMKPGNWQHVFVTYDGSGRAEGVKIYIDGKAANLNFEANKLKSTTKSKAPLFIGQRKSSLPVNGVAIQDVRIYGRKLADFEVQRMATQFKFAALLNKAPKDRQPKEKDEFFDTYTDDDAQLIEGNKKVAALEEEKKAIRQRSAVAHIQEEKRGSMPMANILFRGEYDKPKDKVDAAVFGALNPLPPEAPKNRLGLAQWLVSPENPLTARVIVNRIWQEFFGVGIVKTAEDFGIMGDAPTHQELLDYLAVDFRENGWDMKKLVKQIVMSATYRQSAVTNKKKLEKDLHNRYLSRGPRFRMDAEMIRDYALASSGLLSGKIGGPSVRPYQPENVWEAVAMPGSNTRDYKRDAGEGLYRRSLYTFWKRAAPPAAMEILNAPNREVSCVRRERTNTPLQALVTLNDPQMIEAARVLAQNVIKSKSNGDAERLNYIALRVLARPLNSVELKLTQQVQSELLAHYKANPDDAKALLGVGEVKADANLEPTELAAWTMVCNQMLNLDEALNK